MNTTMIPESKYQEGLILKALIQNVRERLKKEILDKLEPDINAIIDNIVKELNITLESYLNPTDNVTNILVKHIIQPVKYIERNRGNYNEK